MSAITAKSPHDSSFSFSRRFFHRKKDADEDDDDDGALNTAATTSSSYSHSTDKHDQIPPKKNHSISKLKSAFTFTFFARNRPFYHSTRPVIGTLFGRRRGHVRLAFQSNPKSGPSFLIELATPTSVLIREMASGLVRIALECEKTAAEEEETVGLLEEPRWRAYCNGRKCGYANNKIRECGDEEWKVLKAVEPITMGAGVLPATAGSGKGNEAGGSDGELMYMRAKFERVVGSKDSEAFYMMNPDQGNNNNGGPELSIYLLRV